MGARLPLVAAPADSGRPLMAWGYRPCFRGDPLACRAYSREGKRPGYGAGDEPALRCVGGLGPQALCAE